MAWWWSQCSSSPPCPAQTPSSDFWKELCLALPRKVSFQGAMGDPQTQLQEDKDPMLILHSSYLDSGGDLHPDGDLGTGPWPCCFSRGAQMCTGGHLWALLHPPVAGGLGFAPSPPPKTHLPAPSRSPRLRFQKPPASLHRWPQHCHGSGCRRAGGRPAEGRPETRARRLRPGLAQLRRPHRLLLPGDRR